MTLPFYIRSFFLSFLIFNVAAYTLLSIKSSPVAVHSRIYGFQNIGNGQMEEYNPRQFTKLPSQIAVALATLFSTSQIAFARPEGVNRPDLLPKTQVSVIDVANYLSKGQEKKIIASIDELEKATGYKLRLLCQVYPNTPGLAIKDYWGVDENTVVVVIDRGEGFSSKGIPSNMIRLNLGKNVNDALSPKFWQRLTNKLGNQPYVKANGEDIAILNTVEAIKFCLQDKTCQDIPFSL